SFGSPAHPELGLDRSRAANVAPAGSVARRRFPGFDKLQGTGRCVRASHQWAALSAWDVVRLPETAEREAGRTTLPSFPQGVNHETYARCAERCRPATLCLAGSGPRGLDRHPPSTAAA